MKNNLYLILLSFLVLSLTACKHGNKHSSKKKNPHVIETFVDSTNIGKKTFDKVEITLLQRHLNEPELESGNRHAIVKFYVKQENHWVLKNHFDVACQTNGLVCDVNDINNDTFNDVTFEAFLPGNGANSDCQVLLYDNVNDRLVNIKNSARYPNMYYSKEVGCLCSHAVYGGCTTYFLRLEADTLRSFAEADWEDNELTVSLVSKNGNRKVIKHDTSMFKECPGPLVNYNPLKPLSH
jgi:hypothetical protein